VEMIAIIAIIHRIEVDRLIEVIRGVGIVVEAIVSNFLTSFLLVSFWSKGGFKLFIIDFFEGYMIMTVG